MPWLTIPRIGSLPDERGEQRRSILAEGRAGPKHGSLREHNEAPHLEEDILPPPVAAVVSSLNSTQL